MTGAVLALSVTPAAYAQSQDQDALMRCLGIEIDTERLACFDRVAREQAEAARSGVSSEAGRQAETGEEDETRRFGMPRPAFPDFSLPSLSLGRRDSGAELTAGETGSTAPAVPVETEILERAENGDIDRVMMTIDRISTHGYNTKRFHMTNGQVWEVTDGMRFWVPRGEDVMRAEIRRAGAGGYLLRINGEGRAIRVQRIDL